MEGSKDGYKTAFKATTLFGGVQIVTIVIGIIKSKFIALWLGPSGYGIMSLFNSAINFVSSISNLGLSSSAIRDISQANSLNDGKLQLAKSVKAINRCILITGLIGTLFTIALSYFLSFWAFGSSIYTQSFILLSITVIVNGVYGGHYATLQGVRRLSAMAKARIWGSFLSVVITLPLFYFYKERGIVLALILNSLITCLISWIYAAKIELPKVKQSFKESFVIGKSTIKLGIMMAISAISVSLVEFILKTFITKRGGVLDVGLYQAGWTLNAQYLGLVFTAMATDYFPRISGISADNKLLKKAVNEQAEIAVLIIGPMVTVMLVFMPVLIRVLYSNDFIEIVPMARWLMIGSLIKAGSWAVSFVFLAKGDGKTFLFNELGINLITLPLYLLGYCWFGISGIGYAYTLSFVVYFIWVVFMANKKYDFSYSHVFTRLLLVQMIIPLLTIYLITLTSGFMMYFIVISIVVFITVYSLFELNKRLDFVSFITKRRR